MLISREVVKPDYAMFVSLAEDHRYHIHSASKHQPHHLDYFKFMGRVWGKAAYDGFLIESHLTSAVYKYLLGIPITRVNALLPRQHTTNHHTLLSLPPSTMTKSKAQSSNPKPEQEISNATPSVVNPYPVLMWAHLQGDLQHVDGAYHQSLQWLLDNDIDSKEEGGTSLDMTFAIDEEELGCVTTVLCPTYSEHQLMDEIPQYCIRKCVTGKAMCIHQQPCLVWLQSRSRFI
jgi:hypothetical protein